MAFTLSEIQAFTNRWIVPKATEVIFNYSPLLHRVMTKNRERFAGGTQIQRILTVGKLKAGVVGKGGAFDINPVTTEAAMLLDMKVYWCNITLFGFDEMLNTGDQAVFNQVELKYNDASRALAELMAQDLFSDGVGARSDHISGFEEWVDDGNGYSSIGGITRSDITAVGTVGGLNAYTKTLTTFTLKDLNAACTAAWDGPDQVDIIPVTPNGWDLVWNALQPNRRYPDPNSDLAQAGFQTIRFNSADIAMDRLVPSGTNGRMFGINSNYVELYFSAVPKFQFGTTGFKEQANSIDYVSQFLVGWQLLVPGARRSFKLKSTLF